MVMVRHHQLSNHKSIVVLLDVKYSSEVVMMIN